MTMQGLIGKKIGMTQVYEDDGRRTAVTVIAAGPCVVTQRKCVATDGYDAVQVGFAEQKEHRVTKPMLGVYKKAGVAPQKCVREFRVDSGVECKAGDTLDVSVFDGASHVDIAGTSKGRGFQGAVKRYRMGGGPATHGGHSKRRIGAIGQCEFPGRVAKGKRMPGHMGNVRVTQQNLRIVRLDKERNLLLVAGAVPGPNGGTLVVKRALKKQTGNG